VITQNTVSAQTQGIINKVKSGQVFILINSRPQKAALPKEYLIAA
jgi:hypothetical protein